MVPPTEEEPVHHVESPLHDFPFGGQESELPPSEPASVLMSPPPETSSNLQDGTSSLRGMGEPPKTVPHESSRPSLTDYTVNTYGVTPRPLFPDTADYLEDETDSNISYEDQERGD